MKKAVLFTLVVLLMAEFGICQERIKGNLHKSEVNVNYYSIEKSYGFTATPIGTSDRVSFTTTISTSNEVVTLPSLNMVGFIHQTNTATFTSTSNLDRYLPRLDISIDNGNTWNTDRGPLVLGTNVSYIQYIFTPQGVLLPTGTNVADIRLVLTGTGANFGVTGIESAFPVRAIAWDLNNLTAAQNNNLAANPTKSYKIDPIPYNGLIESSITYNIDQTGNINTWVVNRGYDGAQAIRTDTIYLLRGDLTNNGQNMSWMIQDKLKIGATLRIKDSSAIHTNPVIAFSPNGKYGWIALTANLDKDGNPYNVENFWGLNPIFFKSSDYGQTWTGPIEVDLTQFPELISSLKGYIKDQQGNIIDSTSQIPYAGGFYSEFDLTVDYNGNPHFLCTVYNHLYKSKPLSTDTIEYILLYPKILIDVTTPDLGQTWKIKIIDTLQFAYWIDQNNTIRIYSNVQITRNEGGTVIGYVWMNDTSAAPGSVIINSYPWSAGWRLTDSIFAEKMGHADTGTFAGKIYWFKVGDKLLYDTNFPQNYIIPIVFTDTDAPFNAHIQWYYTASVRLDTSRFGSADTTVNITKNNNIIFYAFPNPVSNTLHLYAKSQGANTISIYNINGKLVFHKNIISYGTLKESIDISELPRGIYFIELKNTEGIKRLKIIKE